MWRQISGFIFFFNDTATTEIYTLSLHDALPISATRAQLCLAIANYTLDCGETIAERIYREHSNSFSHLRAARLLVDLGCAVEKNETSSFYGKFVFEDGSSF